jgi:putative ABC transport system permease protein
VTTFRQAQPGLRRFWDQLGTYLGLTGLVALLVGGIGVASTVRAWVKEKVATIAILKCLGAGWRHILAIYLTQTALLGGAGSLLGAVAGAGLQWALAPVLAPLLPLEVELMISPLAALRGVTMGIGVTLLCALWPLLEIRDVPPALILRREVEPRRPGRRPWAMGMVIAGGLAALILWQAGSLTVGGLFMGGIAGGLGVLAGAARLACVVARRLTRFAPSLAWRHALANVSRPGSQTATVLVTLGLAVMLVVAVALVERDLRQEISGRGSERAPSFFFVDVQPDQAPALARLLGPHVDGPPPEIIPVVRARLASVKNTPVERDAGRRDEQWYLTREYALTWAAAPPGRNTVVAGRWWTPEEAAREPLVSVEEEIARTLGVGLGDVLGFDIQGVTVTGRVTSLRKVDWRSLNANFFVIFSPGALDGAPLTYIATARVRPENETSLQAGVAAAFPNVSAVPVREVLDRVAAMVDQIALCIRLVGGVSVLAGLIVLAGALGVTRAQRLYESLILRAVGATRGHVARAFALEYSLLGASAGLAGTALATALAWGVERWVLDLPGRWQPLTLSLGVACAAALALLVGALGTFRLLGHRPLSALRGE